MLAASSMLWLDGKRVDSLLRPDPCFLGVSVDLRVAGEQDFHFAFSLLFRVLVEAMVLFLRLGKAWIFNCYQVESATRPLHRIPFDRPFSTLLPFHRLLFLLVKT